jgi:hypothetical protein
MNRGDTKMINTFQDLRNRFETIANKSHKVNRPGPGAIGELLEELMVGAIVGNDRGPDFASINTEAKVHYGKNALTTVFTRKPSQGMTTKEFYNEYGRTTVRVGSVTYKGHTVKVTKKKVSIMVDGVAVLSWTIAELIERIEEKMPNLAMVFATKQGEHVTYDRMAVCRKIVASRFIDSIRNGKVLLDHRGSRGIGFRANPSVIEGWFEVLH